MANYRNQQPTCEPVDENTWLLGVTNDATSTPVEALGTNSTYPQAYRELDSVAASMILKQEARAVVRSSIPVILTYTLQYSFSFFSLLVLGHIGANELAAAALANMALVVIVFSPGIGLASALDTFCSTTFTASRDKTLVGFHLQRGLIAVTCHFIVIVPVIWHLDMALVWLKQDAYVSTLCGQYVRMQLLGVLPWLSFECIKRFLQAQGIMHASTYILLAVMPVHLLSNYVLVWSKLVGVGFIGAAIANVLTNWFILGGISLYTWRSKAQEAWGGWTIQSLWAMPQYFQLAIPATIMICAEWWILDLLALAASYLGSTTLAAQSIVINTCSLTYQIPDGLSVVVCNHVGNLIGQARARRARLTAWLGIAMGAVVGVVTLCAALAVGNWWGYIYSEDARVVACVATIMPACALFQMFDAINSVGSGVLRSIERQNAGAMINFPAYYIVGFPLGLFLTYGIPRMGVLGLWFGICAGVALAVSLQLLICMRTDWHKEVQRCMIRVSMDCSVLERSHKSGDDSTENDSESSSDVATERSSLSR
ncbi:ethionine resistance protein [Coemansia brasiliensis]|uniref:Ethionine resistance protein n=1 Tax=Coemansia brasiliensis TaxID=2650707 RepID=A0A9W8IBD2_9FUNG|nr:ethionine resistance protein [Coemansia brasiliensis]